MNDELDIEPICEYCEANSGIHDFGRDCCVVRFLVSAPSTEVRQNYFAYLSRSIDADRMAMIKAEVITAWEAKRAARIKQQREEALNFGRSKP